MNPTNLKEAVLRMHRTTTIPAEQEKYYRINLSTSWLCNRCEPRDRDRMQTEIQDVAREAELNGLDITQVYAQLLDGRISWITTQYRGLFIGAMEIMTGLRSDLEMAPYEREYATKVALDIYRATLEELYLHK